MYGVYGYGTTEYGAINFKSRIYKQMILLWNLVGRIIRQSTFIWHLASRTAKQIILKWGIAVKIIKQFSLLWNIFIGYSDKYQNQNTDYLDKY